MCTSSCSIFTFRGPLIWHYPVLFPNDVWFLWFVWPMLGGGWLMFDPWCFLKINHILVTSFLSSLINFYNLFSYGKIKWRNNLNGIAHDFKSSSCLQFIGPMGFLPAILEQEIWKFNFLSHDPIPFFWFKVGIDFPVGHSRAQRPHGSSWRSWCPESQRNVNPWTLKVRKHAEGSEK